MKQAWRKLPALAGAALALTCSALANTEAPALPQPRPDIIGEARDPDTGKTLYLEHYYCSDDALQCSVYYLRPNRELIASKELNYQPSLKAPVLTFRDFRLDREVVIEQPAGDAVVDAGFDNFVRLQWQELAEGEEIKFPFRLVDREEPISMRASKTNACEDDKLCLEIELDSWLLGNFVDPIQLTYERDSQRLLRFEGISNLKNDKGRSQTVEIQYRYLEDLPARSSD
jgi:hypothetical protein